MKNLKIFIIAYNKSKNIQYILKWKTKKHYYFLFNIK